MNGKIETVDYVFSPGDVLITGNVNIQTISCGTIETQVHRDEIVAAKYGNRLANESGIPLNECEVVFNPTTGKFKARRKSLENK